MSRNTKRRVRRLERRVAAHEKALSRLMADYVTKLLDRLVGISDRRVDEWAQSVAEPLAPPVAETQPVPMGRVDMHSWVCRCPQRTACVPHAYAGLARVPEDMAICADHEHVYSERAEVPAS